MRKPDQPGMDPFLSYPRRLFRSSIGLFHSLFSLVLLLPVVLSLTACSFGGSRIANPDQSVRSDLFTPGDGSTSPDRLELEVRSVESFLDSLGVCVHFMGPSQSELVLMKDAGIRHLRDEISWDWVERVKGQLRIPPERMEWVEEAHRQGIDILMILNYGNPIYTDQGIGSAKNPDMEFEQFGRYVDFLVTALRDKVHRWEIWNEPNGFGMNRMYGGDWRGGGWVEAYARLADRTLERIRAIDPGAWVVTAGLEVPLADLVVPHLKGDYDAIGIHPYCHPLPPEYTAPEIQRLRDTLQNAGYPIPLVVTEQGYPTVGGVGKFMWRHTATITLEDQARYLLRVYCGNYLRGIPHTYWYDFICDGTDPDEQEHNFGILNAGAKSTRPSYDALKTLTTVLRRTGDRQASPVEAVLGRPVSITVDPHPSAPLRGLLLSRDAGHYFLVLWKESLSKDLLEPNGDDPTHRVFHDDGDPETVQLRMTSFAAGRLEVSVVDPLQGLDSETHLTVSNDGLHDLLTVDVRESPIVIEMRLE